MGILRFYLALSVIFCHYSSFGIPRVFPFCYTAVCCFFMISGFYMALVLSERYRLDAVGLVRFYANRALRLLPTYWTVLALLQVLRWFPSKNILGEWTMLFTLDQMTLLPNVLLRTLRLTPGASNLVIGQAYTVGIEMIFYLAAPLLVLCRTRALLLVWIAAMAALQAPVLAGLPARPWQYEFPPTVFVFFVTGALCYRAWRLLRNHKGLVLAAIPFGFAIPLACVLVDDAHTYDWVRRPGTYLIYAAVAFALPALFEATKNSRLDRLIGDLSYPMYLVQGFAVLITYGHGGPTTLTSSVLALVVTLLLSLALVFFVDRPVERLRQRVAQPRDGRQPDLLQTAPATP